MRLMPVSVWVAVISAPGNTAPLGSWTVPLICAVACARASAQLNTHSRATNSKAVKIRFIHPPSQTYLTSRGGRLSALVFRVKQPYFELFLYPSKESYMSHIRIRIV